MLQTALKERERERKGERQTECVCVTDCVKQAAGLADLCTLIGRFGLEGVVLVQQVSDQNADQVSTARPRQNLRLDLQTQAHV